MAKVASGEPIGVGQLAELVAGTDGTNTVFLKVASDGSLVTAPDSDYGPFAIVGTVNGVGFLTRLSNATAYTAGDEVSDVASSSAHPFVFANAALAVGGGGRITKVRLQSSNPLNVSAIYRLYLFDTIPVMTGDNLAWVLTGSEFGIREGFVDCGPLVTSVGTGVSSINHPCDIEYKCAAADTSLYGVLVIQNAYSPLSAEVMYAEITVRRAS